MFDPFSLGLNFRIEVDGGVDGTTAPRCCQAGADTLVAGSAFFRPGQRDALRQAIRPETPTGSD